MKNDNLRIDKRIISSKSLTEAYRKVGVRAGALDKFMLKLGFQLELLLFVLHSVECGTKILSQCSKIRNNK